MNEQRSSSDALAVSLEPPQLSKSPGCGGPSRTDKPRSGYARQKLRMQRLFAQLDDLKLENARLREELSTFEEVFREVKRLNETLAADLRQAKQRPSTPTFANVLMGARHG
jgi:chromosome segregation ATPase